jgi:hypothetical protein
MMLFKQDADNRLLTPDFIVWRQLRCATSELLSESASPGTLEAFLQEALRLMCADSIQYQEIVESGISQAGSIAYTFVAPVTRLDRPLQRPLLAERRRPMIVLHSGHRPAIARDGRPSGPVN